jgi:hypothetical protein
MLLQRSKNAGADFCELLEQLSGIETASFSGKRYSEKPGRRDSLKKLIHGDVSTLMWLNQQFNL